MLSELLALWQQTKNKSRVSKFDLEVKSRHIRPTTLIRWRQRAVNAVCFILKTKCIDTTTCICMAESFRQSKQSKSIFSCISAVSQVAVQGLLYPMQFSKWDAGSYFSFLWANFYRDNYQTSIYINIYVHIYTKKQQWGSLTSLIGMLRRQFNEPEQSLVQ